MPAADTNILVRLLVEDDPEQTLHAQKLLESVTPQRPLFVPSTVALELEWVLRSVYKFNRDSVLDAFTQLLSKEDILFESESAIEWACFLYRMHPADFADCVHMTLATRAGHQPLFTFDKKAAALPLAQDAQIP